MGGRGGARPRRGGRGDGTAWGAARRGRPSPGWRQARQPGTESARSGEAQMHAGEQGGEAMVASLGSDRGKAQRGGAQVRVCGSRRARGAATTSAGGGRAEQRQWVRASSGAPGLDARGAWSSSASACTRGREGEERESSRGRGRGHGACGGTPGGVTRGPGGVTRGPGGVTRGQGAGRTQGARRCKGGDEHGPRASPWA
nr:spidroin-1-like [Aegilops tauschii subsp. strangulata]